MEKKENVNCFCFILEKIEYLNSFDLIIKYFVNSFANLLSNIYNEKLN